MVKCPVLPYVVEMQKFLDIISSNFFFFFFFFFGEMGLNPCRVGG